MGKRAAVIAGLLCVAILVAPGCVSKKGYKTGMEDMDGRVVAVESAVEANQRRVGDLESQTNQKIQALQGETQQAKQVGQQALTKANQADKKALGKLVWTVTMTDDAVKFDFGKAALTSRGISSLDQLAKRLKSEGKALYLEIEGHTDNIGNDGRNMQLGEQRAMAVRNYLNEKLGIPLHAMNTLSFGEAKPIADNSTKEGRAQNRRVVIRVLE